MEQTDFKNVIVENIHWALFEDAEVAEVAEVKSKWHFQNQWLPLIEMSYRLPYSENFHFSNLLAASEAGGWII